MVIFFVYFRVAEVDLPIDLKQTKHGKTLNFLKFYNDCGLLSLEEINGVASIKSIAKIHQLYKGLKVNNLEEIKNRVVSFDKSSGSKSDEKGKTNKNAINIIELYKFPSNVREIFGNVKGEFGEYLKSNEVRDVIFMYIKASGLECEEDKSQLKILVNSPISKLLFGKRKIEQSENNKESKNTIDETVDAVETVFSSNFNSVAGVLVSNSNSNDLFTKKKVDSSTPASSSGWKPIVLNSAPKPDSTRMQSKNEGSTFHEKNSINKKEKADIENTEIEVYEYLKKNQIMSLLLPRLSSYFAIISSEGNFFVL